MALTWMLPHAHISELSWAHHEFRFLDFLHLHCRLVYTSCSSEIPYELNSEAGKRAHKTFALTPSISKSSYAKYFYVALNSSFLYCQTVLCVTPAPFTHSSASSWVSVTCVSLSSLGEALQQYLVTSCA